MLAPLIPSEIRTILPDFLHLINRPIFRQLFERKALTADGRELAFVAEIHRDAVKAYEGVIEHIASGKSDKLIGRLTLMIFPPYQGNEFRECTTNSTLLVQLRMWISILANFRGVALYNTLSRALLYF